MPSLTKTCLLVAIAVGLVGTTQVFAQTNLPPTEELTAFARAKVPTQEWEQRRAAFAATIRGVRDGDPLARRDFERAVRAFEAKPFDQTPLESMDILGSVFVPQAGIEKLLPVVAAHAALGLYDALRFATPVGQAELLSSENFLRRALTMAGPEQAAASRKFLQEQPAKAAALVQQGLQLANAERQFPAYDAQWVTALGREGAFCPPGSECPKYELPPREQWEQLWQQARERVTAYYTVQEKVQPAAAASAPATK